MTTVKDTNAVTSGQSPEQQNKPQETIRESHFHRKSLEFCGLVPEPDVTPDVTVVVPCYNVEVYLEQCLETILQNDKVQLEVIVINDGSKDKTLEIAKEFESKYQSIHVIDKPNGGYGLGVNVGFDNAHGTYVAIVEPDDYVRPHFYDECFAYAQSFDTLPDIVKTPYIRINLPMTPEENELHCAYYHRLKLDKQPFTLHDCPRLIQHHPSIWSALYLRSFLNEFTIRMMEIPGAGWVDNPFLIETMVQARSIVFLDKEFYCYREDLPGSSSMLRATELAFTRWNQMQDILEDLHVEDPAILSAHTVRGFIYLSGIMSEASIAGTDAEKTMLQIFNRMQPEIVFTTKNIPNGFKQFYANAMGIENPQFNKELYRKALVEEFAYSWRTNGPGFAFSRIGIFIARKLKIAANDPTHTASAGI